MRTHLARNQFREADQQWSLWVQIREKIQHGLILALAAEVGAELALRREDFTVSRSDDNLDANSHIKRLCSFLIGQASLKFDTVEKRCAALHISRQTYYNWLKETSPLQSGAQKIEGKDSDFRRRDV